MIDGFWTVHYDAEGNRGAGVVVLTNGKLYGGDTGFTYIGSYTQTGNSVIAEIHARNFEPSVIGLLGLSNYTLSLHGTVTGDVITASATTPQSPDVVLEMRLEKRSAL